MTPPDLDQPPFDLAATAVRALVLYALAEFQSGRATTIHVTARGAEFGVSDDGRGHPPDKLLEGTPYLRFVYTHFDYPFEAGRAAPVQLQGIGMSLVNALSAQLTLVLRKPEETLQLCFAEGRLQQQTRTPGPNAATGVSVHGRLRPGLCTVPAPGPALEDGLRAIVRAHPTLRLFFNGDPLHA